VSGDAFHATVEEEGEAMRRLARVLVVAGLVVVLSAGGAWAFKCPSLAKQANELLSSVSSNTDKYKKVKGLVEEGEKLHKDAKHADAVKTLEEALKILRTP
jgi:hypothetical protein